MPLTVKKSNISFRGEDGKFHTTNILAENSTSQLINEIQIKGEDTLKTIPDDYLTLYNTINTYQEKPTSDVFYAKGADYAEIATWNDLNTGNEDRLYRFVTLSGSDRKISIANSTSQIVGVTSNTAAFIGNTNNYDPSDKTKAVVGIVGIVKVKTNDNTIVANNRVMSDNNGYAIKSSNNCGYRVLRVVETGLLEIVVSPNTDMIQRIKSDVVEINTDISTMSTKLDGIAEGANNYTHPSYTSKSSGLYKITVDNTGHVSGTTAVAKSDITGLGIPAQDTTYSAASQSAAGLMSAADKTKLDGIASGANNYTYTHPSYTSKTSGLYKITVDGTGHVSGTTAVAKADITGLGIPAQDTTYNAASQSAAGLMSAADKTKLDGIATGANNYTYSLPTAGTNSLGGVKTTSDVTSSTGYIASPIIDGVPYYKDTNTTYSDATQSTHGLMSTSDKTKLDGIASGANNYSLPTASSTLGGVKTTSTVSSTSGLTASPIINGVVYYKDTNTTYNDMTAASASAAGTHGLVPAPAAGNQGKYLRGDGTWQTPTNTTYNAASQSAAGLMSAADKTKLDGIATGANNYTYTHPTYTSKTSGLYKITVDSTGHISAATAVAKSDITGLGIPAQDTTYNDATTSTHGLMSTDDKTKLDGIATGANNYSHPTYTSKTSGLYKITVDGTGHVSAATAVAKSDITGLGIPAQDTTYSAASQSAAGLMSAADKTKLDGVATGANNYSHPSNHAATMITTDSTHRFVTDTEKSTWNAKVGLDANGLIPSSVLPSFVDDVIEGYLSSSKFYKTRSGSSGSYTYSSEITGETGKIYVDLASNKTYRYSGSAFVVISETLALGETSSTAYAGNKGKANADAIANIINGTTTVPSATNATKVNNLTVQTAVPANAKFTDTTYAAATTSTAGLMSAADKTKLDGIATGANNYSHPTTSGNKHIPSGGSSGQILRWSADGTAAWGADNNSWRGIQNNLTSTSTSDSLSAYQGKLLNDTKAVMNTLTNEDLNNVVTPGFYNAGGGNTVTNKPSGVEHFGLIVIHRASGAYYTQIIYNDTTSYRRLCVNGTWGNWSEDKLTDTTYSDATTSVHGLMSTSDKSKLNGIASGANNYTHPSYTAKSSGLYKITVDATGHVSAATAVAKADITGLGIPAQDTTYNAATTSAAGLMSAADKTKLDGVSTGANNYTHPSYTSKTSGLYKITVDGTGHVSAATAVAKADITGLGIPAQDTTYSAASQSAAGLMSAADKTKLDGIATGANNYTYSLPTAGTNSLGGVKTTSTVSDNTGYIASPIISGVVYYKDTNTTYSDATQSTHGLMSTSDKTKLDGIATGANNYSHPTTSGNKHIPSGGSAGQFLKWSADGTAVWAADNNTTYSDATQSTHGLMSTSDKTKLDGIATGANNYSLPTATSSVLGGVKTGDNITNTSGVISLTKSNVTTALGYTPPTTNTTYSAATTSAAGLMSAADKTKLDGVATGANNYTHPTSSGNKHIPSGGSSGQILRWSADGTAAWGSDNNTTYSAATTSAAGLMSAADKTKLDGIATGANNYTYTHPTTSGNKHIPSGGSSGQILRWSADGTAAWGADNNTTYSAATTSTAGLMSAADKTKLDGIATGANNYTYTHPTTSGNKHIPSGGSSGQILRWSADGTAAWDTVVTSHTATLSNGTTATTTKGYTYGTAAVTSSPYTASKWYANLNTGVTSLTDGMMISIKVPVAGNGTYGTLLTIDGTNFHPVVTGVSSHIGGRYAVNSIIVLVYNSIQTRSVYQNSTSAANVTGIWVVVNDCNFDTVPSTFCSTAAGTAAKIGSHSNYTLLNNSYTLVTMIYSNTYNGKITLNINGKGAKDIYINGTISSSTNKTLPAGTYLVYYDGAGYWFRTDGRIPGVTASTSAPGLMSATDKAKLDNVCNVYTGTSEPSDSLGNNGDFYFMIID